VYQDWALQGTVKPHSRRTTKPLVQRHREDLHRAIQDVLRQMAIHGYYEQPLGLTKDGDQAA